MKRKISSVISLVLVLAMCLSLVLVIQGCSSNETTEPTPSPEVTAEPTPEVTPEPTPEPTPEAAATEAPTVTSDGNTSFVTAVEGAIESELRNDFAEFVGMQVEMKANVTVTSLGRIFVEGNAEKHTIKIVDVETMADVASVEIDMSAGEADSLGFKYAALQTPVTLAAGKKYYIASNNTVGGDKWYGNTKLPTLKTTDIINGETQGVYFYGGAWTIYQPGCYIPVNFKY